LGSSEIGLVVLRDGHDVVIEEVGVVLAAGILGKRAIGSPPALHRRPRHIESTRIVDGDRRLERLFALDHAETFDDVNLIGMGRAVIIDGRAVVQPDGVDDERIAFVMTDRFSVPGRFQMLGMRHVQINVAHLRVQRS
jgi:hypothetical protein